jgi:hypothetical protein
MIKVKLTKKGGAHIFKRQFPDPESLIWNDLQFSLDPNCKDYDWLCLIDRGVHIEKIDCDPNKTIFIATEPSSITYYGKNFVKQFGYILTNQSSKNLPHKRAIRHCPGNHWFYEKPYQKIANDKPYNKTKLISAIATNKVEKHTYHYLRYQIIKNMSEQIKNLDILYSYKKFEHIFQSSFKNAKYVTSKSSMIDDYKYHLAIGNELGADILTERVTDAFLGFSVPIVWGCTNISNYFPEKSFIEIDITKPDESIQKILKIINNPDDYKERLESVIEARNLVLTKYNLMGIIEDIIQNHDENQKITNSKYIFSRRIIRILNPMELIGFGLFKLRNFTKNFLN